MSAREQALTDIKTELDIQASDDNIVRKNVEKRWYMYSNKYVWDGFGDSWTLRISHLVNHEKYFNIN